MGRTLTNSSLLSIVEFLNLFTASAAVSAAGNNTNTIPGKSYNVNIGDVINGKKLQKQKKKINLLSRHCHMTSFASECFYAILDF